MSNERHGVQFSLAVDPAPCEMARDATRVGALVTVTARGGGGGAAGGGFAGVIIVDRSGSMHRHGKLEEAKRAVAAAIGALADGTRFAVIAGNHSASQVYPADGALAPATDRTRNEARIKLAHYVAEGGTAMSTWIRMADTLLAPGPGPGTVRHAVLYTDGINESETQEKLDSALRSCRDHFVCDVRGVGADWDYPQLQQIADAMQGRVKAVTDITGLSADFVELMKRAQESRVPGAVLRLTLDRRFRLESVRQVRPVWNDLTGRCAPQDGGVVDVPLLAWGEEARDYQVMLSVDPGTLPYEEVRAARVDMVAGQPGEPLSSAAPAAITVQRQRYEGPGPVDPTATWIHDMARLIAAMRAGTGACDRGDRDTALRELTKAVKIARRIGARRHLEDLKRLVTIDEFGEVRLRDDITRAELLETATCSGVTGDVRRPGEPDPGGAAGAEPPLVRRVCPRGHVTVAPVVNYCEEAGCGYKFPD